MEMNDIYKICAFCGRPTRTSHHLIFGYGKRPLADKDKLVIDICYYCHTENMKPIERIHGNSMAEKLSKMLGQALYEKNAILNGISESDARKQFTERYGESYL